MSRPARGARLHKFTHRPQFYIRDTGQPDKSTGCTSRREAEKVLAAHIATKGRNSHSAEPAHITCAEILVIYAEEHAPSVANPERIGYAIDALLPFWSEVKLSFVTGGTCRRYEKTRGKSAGTIRRELGTLQAAINYAHREGYITSAPVVTLPPKPEPKDKWLTRDEAARLLWAAWRGHKSKHLAKFILIAIYTGTRKDAILRMGFEPNTIGGWFDLDREIMFRKSEGERVTNKRRTPAPIPRQLLSHLKRWKSQGCIWAVEYEGARVGNINRAFIRAATASDLEGVTPHTLKHTAITWAMQSGVPSWEIAGYFSTSEETINKVYAHHAPGFMESAKRAMERGSK